jgi:cobalt/nickel transport system permease protein
LTSLQIGFSGTSPFGVVLPAMLGVHVLIGIGEALITVAALGFIARMRPDLLNSESTTAKGGQGWAVGGLLVALAVVLFSPLASSDPDGLEKVAEDIGFLGLGQSAPYEIIPDYTVPFLGETSLSTIVAGMIGALIVAGLAFMIARSLSRKTA